MRSGDQPLRGVVMLLASLVFMAVMSAMVKYVSPRQGLAEILFYRFAGSLLPLLLVTWRRGGFVQLRTSQPWQHVIRSAFGVLGIGLYFYALGAIPIADATALTYSAPMFLVVFAVLMLSERVDAATWLAVLVGFAGMLLIANPRGHGIGIGTLAAIGSAVFGALVSVWIRRLSAMDAPVTIAVFYNTFGMLVGGAWWLLAGGSPGLDADTAVMVLMGLLGGAQQYFMTTSFRYAEASLLAPLQYALLVFAGLVGWMAFDEVPTAGAVAGAVIIAASGVFIVRRRGRRA